MLFAKVSVLLLVISTKASIGVAFSYKYEDSDNFVAEKCITKNNEPGYCQEYLNCKSAQQLYHTGRAAEIKVCKYSGNVLFVCCPSVPKTLSIPKLIKKTSSKFQKALCKNIQTITKIDDHIINGNRAAVGEFPFQVALGYKSENGMNFDFNCGGSLIAEDIVLTAAHCVNRRDVKPVMVRLGRTSLDLTDEDDDTIAQDIEIETIKIHPKYKRSTRHSDIALIKLRESAAPSYSVETICLSTKDDIPENEFTITGFGRISSKNNQKSDWLLKGKVTEYPLEECKEKFGIVGVKIVESQLCAISEKRVDACQGDSGGPVFYEENNVYYLQAITSFGSSCGGTYPAIYTRVTKFLDWIEEEMSNFESSFRSF